MAVQELVGQLASAAKSGTAAAASVSASGPKAADWHPSPQLQLACWLLSDSIALLMQTQVSPSRPAAATAQTRNGRCAGYRASMNNATAEHCMQQRASD